MKFVSPLILKTYFFPGLKILNIAEKPNVNTLNSVLSGLVGGM